MIVGNLSPAEDEVAKGYLPYAVQDEYTKVYKIPEDTPKPYKGNFGCNSEVSLISSIIS